MTDMKEKWGVADIFSFILKSNVIEINYEVQQGIQIPELS